MNKAIVFRWIRQIQEVHKIANLIDLYHSYLSKYFLGSGNLTCNDLLNKNYAKKSIGSDGFWFTISTMPSVRNGTTLSFKYYLKGRDFVSNNSFS